MEPHHFKIIHSPEEEVYRIVDLTDTSLVGITELFENEDVYERSIRAEYTNEIRANKGLRAKIVVYGIFISFDDNNTKWVPVPERNYLLSVLRQMASFFKEKVIDNNPEEFVAYLIPGRDNKTTVGKRKETSVLSAKGSSTTAETKGTWKKITSKEWFVPVMVAVFIWGVILTDIFVFDSWLINKIEEVFIYILSGLAFIPVLL